ncbi:MAG: SDR family NAD(P)-dependent oxidoreductase [Sporolactobacillus sp.]
MRNIAIITGASSGIGRAMVKEISRSDHSIEEVWLIARRGDEMKTLAGELAGPVRVMVLDLRQPESFTELASALAAGRPVVRWLVNAAGYGKFAAVGDLPLTEELGMIRLNCEALTAVTSLCLPYMPVGAHIIQIASAAAFAPQPRFGIYAATKAYVLSFSRALNEELRARCISVTAVCPGPVDTAFFQTAGSSNKGRLARFIPKSSAEAEARHALKDSRRRRSVSTYGPVATGFRVAAKLLPAALLLLAGRGMLRRASKQG